MGIEFIAATFVYSIVGTLDHHRRRIRDCHFWFLVSKRSGGESSSTESWLVGYQSAPHHLIIIHFLERSGLPQFSSWLRNLLITSRFPQLSQYKITTSPSKILEALRHNSPTIDNIWLRQPFVNILRDGLGWLVQYVLLARVFLRSTQTSS